MSKSCLLQNSIIHLDTAFELVTAELTCDGHGFLAKMPGLCCFGRYLGFLNSAAALVFPGDHLQSDYAELVDLDPAAGFRRLEVPTEDGGTFRLYRRGPKLEVDMSCWSDTRLPQWCCHWSGEPLRECWEEGSAAARAAARLHCCTDGVSEDRQFIYNSYILRESLTPRELAFFNQLLSSTDGSMLFPLVFAISGENQVITRGEDRFGGLQRQQDPLGRARGSSFRALLCVDSEDERWSKGPGGWRRPLVAASSDAESEGEDYKNLCDPVEEPTHVFDFLGHFLCRKYHQNDSKKQVPDLFVVFPPI